MSELKRQGSMEWMTKAFKFILDSELHTPEGRVNTSGMVLAAVVSIAYFFSGSELLLQNSSEGWSFSVTLGDSLGSMGMIVGGTLFCTLIVAGTNLYRERGGQQPTLDDH